LPSSQRRRKAAPSPRSTQVHVLVPQKPKELSVTVLRSLAHLASRSLRPWLPWCGFAGARASSRSSRLVSGAVNLGIWLREQELRSQHVGPYRVGCHELPLGFGLAPPLAGRACGRQRRRSGASRDVLPRTLVPPPPPRCPPRPWCWVLAPRGGPLPSGPGASALKPLGHGSLVRAALPQLEVVDGAALLVGYA